MNNNFNYRIYKITSPSLNLCYIGSTKNRLCLRKCQHKHHYKLYQKNKFNYVSSFQVLEDPLCHWEIIENDIIDKEVLKEREKYYINHFENSVNRNYKIKIKC